MMGGILYSVLQRTVRMIWLWGSILVQLLRAVRLWLMSLSIVLDRTIDVNITRLRS